jgi:glyceraldehyde 3-phosphate dehydrogenase
MSTPIGINGFGRIGRAFVRRCLDRRDLDVVAINDITDAHTLAHLLEFDSTYGRLAAQIEYADNAIVVNGKPITVLSIKDPAAIDWGSLGADIVIESTGNRGAGGASRPRRTDYVRVPGVVRCIGQRNSQDRSG